MKYVVFNWKMNPKTLTEANRLFTAVKKSATGLKRVNTIIAPPAVFLHDLSRGYRGKSVAFSAQNVFYEQEGSYTGEMSPAQAKDAGAGYAVIGHAERRAMGESDEVVRRKVSAALQVHLKPIIAVGERERDEDGEYVSIVRAQIKAALTEVPPSKFKNVLLTYEPTWTIGMDDAPDKNSVHQMMLLVRKTLLELFGKDAMKQVRVLYGGSVNPENAADIFSVPDLDGVLIGRVSLVPAQLHEVLKIANRK
ncbi:MAG: triose-phosphate isomerase [bacterium]|nr:triose-phosphate isomerase [bacterium]